MICLLRKKIFAPERFRIPVQIGAVSVSVHGNGERGTGTAGMASSSRPPIPNQVNPDELAGGAPRINGRTRNRSGKLYYLDGNRPDVTVVPELRVGSRLRPANLVERSRIAVWRGGGGFPIMIRVLSSNWLPA